MTSSSHLRYSQLWYGGRLRSRSLLLCPLPDWCDRGWQSQTLMRGAAWWSPNPALEYRHSTEQYWYTCISLPVQTQLRYLYVLLSHHHSPTSSDLAIMITPFSAHTLEQRHLSTRLHSSHPPAEICSEWLLDLDEQLFMANSNPCGFKGTWYLPV